MDNVTFGWGGVRELAKEVAFTLMLLLLFFFTILSKPILCLSVA